MADFAWLSDFPMARRTWLGVWVPAEQAEVEEAAIPYRSIISRRLSPYTLSKDMLIFPDRRFSRLPFRCASGIFRRLLSSLSRSFVIFFVSGFN